MNIKNKLLFLALCSLLFALRATAQNVRWEQIKPISAQLEKSTPNANDLLLIEDSEDAQKKKYVKFSKFAPDLSGIRDTLQLHSDSLTLAFDSIAAHNQRLIVLESETGGGSKFIGGVVSGRNINVTLAGYTPAIYDMIHVLPDSDIAFGDTITLSFNGGTPVTIFEYFEHDEDYAIELVYRDTNWFVVGNKAEEYTVKNYNTGDQTLSLSSDTIWLTGSDTASYVLITGSTAQDLSSTKAGNNVTVNISGGDGTTFSVADADSSATNEIQDLSLSGNTLSLSDDLTTVDLSGYLDNTDSQNLTYATYSDKGIMNISGGTGDTIPAVTSVNAGLMLPGDKNKLDSDILTIVSGEIGRAHV